MQYRNKSRYKMLIQLDSGVKEVLPNEVFNTPETLEYSFLEEIKASKLKVIRKPKAKKPVEPPKESKETLDGSNSTSS